MVCFGSDVSRVVDNAFDTRVLRAMGATVDFSLFPLHAMTDDPAPAMPACRRQAVDGALEGVKMEGLSVHGDFERIAVIVSAAVTRFHGN